MSDYPPVFAIPTGDPRWRVYLYSIKDVPGVVATNTFLSVFNPVGSGKLHIALNSIVTTYAAAVATTLQSLHVNRTTASSGGTLVTASNVPRFVTAFEDPSSEVRHTGATITAVPEVLATFPPVISTGTGASAGSVGAVSGASFVMFPGQGLAWTTDAGDADQIWNITYVWAEVGIDSVEG